MDKKLDSSQTLDKHRDIIRSNLFLNNLYRDWYDIFKNERIVPGKKVELGSGAGFLKEIIPQVITSDVLPGKGIDKVFKAENMPFKNNSISAFFMLNVFHHIKKPQKALEEMRRCLKPGGKIIMIETFNTFWSNFIYKNFHHEDFNPTGGWEIAGKGRLSDSNQALPWIVFVRDKKIFNKKFPEFRIVEVTPHTPFSYLVSGGLSKPSLIPYPLFNLIQNLEIFLKPLISYIGMFATIVIEKRNKLL